jgi:hypothetical protein
MFHKRSNCLAAACLLLAVLSPGLSGCGKSTLLGSDSYYGFTPDSLRAHGMIIAGVGSQAEETGQTDLLTQTFYDRVWKTHPGLWESLPFDLHSELGTEKYDRLIAGFVKKGTLKGDEVLEIVRLKPPGRYAALGRLLTNAVSHDRETTEQMSPDYGGAPIPGYVYKTSRTIEVETVLYDLKTGSLVWRSTRRADHTTKSDFVADESAKESDEPRGFWGILDWFFGLFGPGEPTGEELKKYPAPIATELLAGDLFDDVAADLAGETD